MTTVKSPKKLTGFAPYLHIERHASTGKTRGKLIDEYVYEIPDDMAARAVDLGGVIVVVESALNVPCTFRVDYDLNRVVIKALLSGTCSDRELEEVACRLDNSTVVIR